MRDRETAEDFKESLNFWRELYPTVSLPLDIWYELSDFYWLMNSMQQVIPHVTNGKISKLNTTPEDIKAVHDDEVTEIVEEEVRFTKEEIRQELYELLNGYNIAFEEGDKETIEGLERALRRHLGKE